MPNECRHLNDFIRLREEQICTRVNLYNSKYRKLGVRSIDIQNEITSNTPDEIHFLLLENLYLESAQKEIIHQKLYKQGLVDGIKLSRFIRKSKK